MPTLMDMLVGKLALRRDMLSAASLRDCMAEQHGQPSLPLGQILVRRRLLASGQLVELVRSAERAELSCARCQGVFAPMALNPSGGLACPRCGATLQILFEGQAVSDRLATGQSLRIKQGFQDPHPSSRRFNTRRDSSTQGGTKRFRGSLTRGDFEGAFGNYEIVEELGRGGMGVVYKARQPHLDRYVALKILLAGELASSKQVKRFQREAEIAARLKHPNIVQIHDVGQIGDYHYFTMDFIEGQPLNKLIKQRKLGIRRAIEIALDVARGLEHAHQRGAIHRDIKPANLLVDTDGRGVITDFGLARDMDPNALSQLTRSGAAVGTPYYMSPEQAQGKRDKINGSTDVYSLGVVLFESLTFELPFNAETQLELTTKILSEDPPRPTSIEPAIDRDVETIVLKTMAKHPADRYASAGELADDLERYLRGEPIQARRAGPLAAARRALRKHWRGAAVAVLVLSCVALTTFAVVRELDRRSGGEGGDLASPTPTASASATPSETAPPSLPELAAERARTELDEAARSPNRGDYRALLQRARPTLREAIDLNPDDTSLRLLRARTLERLREFPDAEGDYRWVMERDPKGAAGAEACFRLANMQIERAPTKEEEQESVPLLADGFQRADPRDAGAWRELLKALLALTRDADTRAAQIALSLARDLAPDEPEVHMLRAQVFLTEREVQAALEAYQRAVDLDPKSARAWAGLGHARALTGEAERAVEDELERALELDPLLVRARLLRAQIYQAGKQYKRAISDLRLVLDQDPDNTDYLIFLSQLYELDKRPGEAEELLRKAEEHLPNDPLVVRIRCHRAMNRGDFKGALAVLREGIVKFWPDRAVRRELLSLNETLVQGASMLESQAKLADMLERRFPNDLDAKVRRAEFFFYDKRIEEGYNLLDAILEQAPSNLAGRVLELKAARVTKLPEAKAQALLAKFEQDFAGNAEALGFACRFYAVLFNDFENATRLGLRVLDEDPQNLDALIMLGLVSLQTKEFARGIELLERAIELAPYDSEALGLCAHGYLEVQQPRQAEDYFMRSLSYDPFRVDTLQGLVELFLRTRRPKQAEALIRTFLRTFEQTGQPAPPSIALMLAEVIATQGDFPRAIALASDIDAKVPNDPRIKFTLARLHAQAGQLPEARAVLEAILAIDPENAPAKRMLEQINQ